MGVSRLQPTTASPPALLLTSLFIATAVVASSSSPSPARPRATGKRRRPPRRSSPGTPPRRCRPRSAAASRPCSTCARPARAGCHPTASALLRLVGHRQPPGLAARRAPHASPCSSRAVRTRPPCGRDPRRQRPRRLARPRRRGEPRPLPAGGGRAAPSRRHPAQARRADLPRLRHRRLALGLLPGQRPQARLVRHLSLRLASRGTEAASSTRTACGASPTTAPTAAPARQGDGQLGREYLRVTTPPPRSPDAALRPGRARGVHAVYASADDGECSCARRSSASSAALPLQHGHAASSTPSRRSSSTTSPASPSTAKRRASSTPSTRAATRAARPRRPRLLPSCSCRRCPTARPRLRGRTSPRRPLHRLSVDNRATAPPTSFVLDWKTGTLAQWHAAQRARRSTRRASRRQRWSRTRRATARRSRCSCAGPRSVRRRPAPWSSSSTAGPRGSPRPGFNPGAQLFVDAGFILRRAQRARQRRLRQDLAPRRRRPQAPRRDHRHRGLRALHPRARGRRTAVAAQDRHHRRQLRRLLDAGRHDDVRRRLRRRRLGRRHQQPDHVPQEHRRLPPRRCAPPSTAIRTRTATRCSSSPPSPTSTR